MVFFLLISFFSLLVLFLILDLRFDPPKKADVAEQMLIEGGLHPLLNLASRKLPSIVQNGSSVLDDIAMIQAIGARCISHLSTNRQNLDDFLLLLLLLLSLHILTFNSSFPHLETNQVRIIEDKKNGLDLLFKLLSSQNELVRKYVAKSLAFLSLRNGLFVFQASLLPVTLRVVN